MFERVYCKMIKERLEEPIPTDCNPTVNNSSLMPLL